MNAFNKAFVGLMGTEDIGPINNESAGLPAQDMELFRQFALAITFPPNPYREVDDTLPCPPRSIDPLCEVQPHGLLFPGNPADGELLFDTGTTDGGGPCVACHTHPFGAGGGKLGGVEPQEPTSMDAAAMFIGFLDQSIHSDLKIPHLRNIHEKFGPVWAVPGDGTMPETVTSFGFSHDGAAPDLFRFLSVNVFTLSAANQAQQVRDIASFMFHFPTGTRPAVGRQVTVPQGTAPTGSSADETLLATLISLGNLADGNRHCELTATTLSGGRARAYHLSGGSWVTDDSGEASVATNDLRENATAPITFTCATLGAGARLGGNRDEDVVLDGNDCAAGDPETWIEPVEVDALVVERDPTTRVAWTEQASVAGPSVRYDVAGGLLSDLRSMGLATATACLSGNLEVAQYEDPRPDPAPGDGYFYLTRAENPCAVSGFGSGREALDALDCSAP